MSDRTQRGPLGVAHTIPGTPFVSIQHDIFEPATDVYETDNEIIVKVDIAGVEEDNMEVTIEEGMLLVHGYRTDCSAFSKLAVHRMEIPCGEFQTHVHLPHAVNADVEIDCVYRSGMLTVVLQKEVARKVQITTE